MTSFTGPYFCREPKLIFYSYREHKDPRQLLQAIQYLYSSDDSPAKENLAPAMLPHTLLYKLVTGQYQEYLLGHLVADSGRKTVVSGGMQDLEDGSTLVLTRLFVHPEHRMHLYIQHLLDVLLHLLISKYKDNNRRVCISFNSYNKPLYDWFVRKDEGKAGSIGRQWPKVFEEFKPTGIREINGVSQFVCESTLIQLLEAMNGPQYTAFHRVWYGSSNTTVSTAVPTVGEQGEGVGVSTTSGL